MRGFAQEDSGFALRVMMMPPAPQEAGAKAIPVDDDFVVSAWHRFNAQSSHEGRLEANEQMISHGNRIKEILPFAPSLGKAVLHQIALNLLGNYRFLPHDCDKWRILEAASSFVGDGELFSNTRTDLLCALDALNKTGDVKKHPPSRSALFGAFTPLMPTAYPFSSPQPV